MAAGRAGRERTTVNVGRAGRSWTKLTAARNGLAIQSLRRRGRVLGQSMKSNCPTAKLWVTAGITGMARSVSD